MLRELYLIGLVHCPRLRSLCVGGPSRHLRSGLLSRHESTLLLERLDHLREGFVDILKSFETKVSLHQSRVKIGSLRSLCLQLLAAHRIARVVLTQFFCNLADHEHSTDAKVALAIHTLLEKGAYMDRSRVTHVHNRLVDFRERIERAVE